MSCLFEDQVAALVLSSFSWVTFLALRCGAVCLLLVGLLCKCGLRCGRPHLPGCFYLRQDVQAFVWICSLWGGREARGKSIYRRNAIDGRGRGTAPNHRYLATLDMHGEIAYVSQMSPSFSRSRGKSVRARRRLNGTRPHRERTGETESGPGRQRTSEGTRRLGVTEVCLAPQ